MYEKLIDIGLKCVDNSIPSCKDFDCPYLELKHPWCQDKLIADLTEALMTIESYNAWNEEAAHHLRQKLDSIQLVELRR